MRSWCSGLRAGIVWDLGEALDALYPPVCWLCRRLPARDGFGCDEHALLRCAFDPTEPRCRGCAALLPALVPGGGLCAACRRRARGYRRLLAWGPYRSGAPLREWILALKHGGRKDLVRPAGALLARRLVEAGVAPGSAVLVPVPLHALRRLERGHDQARLLAEAAAEEAGLPCLSALRRTRWTPPQGAAGAVSRAANVRAAFELVRRPASGLAGRVLFVVDDVVASGATVEACATALRAAGPAEVSVLCLARADPASEEAGGTGTLPGP